MENGYNGWTNWETWYASMVLSDDSEYIDEQIEELDDTLDKRDATYELSKWIKDYLWDVFFADVTEGSPAEEFVEASFQRIDFYELAESRM